MFVVSERECEWEMDACGAARISTVDCVLCAAIENDTSASEKRNASVPVALVADTRPSRPSASPWQCHLLRTTARWPLSMGHI